MENGKGKNDSSELDDVLTVTFKKKKEKHGFCGKQAKTYFFIDYDLTWDSSISFSTAGFALVSVGLLSHLPKEVFRRDITLSIL